jgi:hypothetical protein
MQRTVDPVRVWMVHRRCVPGLYAETLMLPELADAFGTLAKALLTFSANGQLVFRSLHFRCDRDWLQS